MENKELIITGGEIPLHTRLLIWARTSVFIIGLVSIGLMVKSSLYGLPSVFKQVELIEIESKVDMLAMAMSEVQDVQVTQAQRGNKR